MKATSLIVWLVVGLFSLTHLVFSGEGERQKMAFPFSVYEQELVIHFQSEAAAKRALLEMEPLFGGHALAVSARYDDNEVNNLKVKDVFDRYGSKATWYLNAPDVFYAAGEDFRPIARQLLENGYSIGGHGFNHPYISYTNRNRMFLEMTKVRVVWESELDTYLNSYAFSFINYRNALEGSVSQADVIRSLERAGFYHLSVFKTFDDQHPSEMIISLIMPPENQSFDVFKGAVDWAMTTESLRDRFLNISHSMHAWYDSPRSIYGMDELEKRVSYMNQFPDLWHSNQNQYAAYRYQYLNTKIYRQPGEGTQVHFRILRPSVKDLNDATPLTMKLSGVKRDEIKEIVLEGRVVNLRADESSQSILFDLSHASEQKLPVTIGRIENPENQLILQEGREAPDFPGLKAHLAFNRDQLIFSLENESGQTLKDVTATYRLPLAWVEGIHKVKLDAVGPSEHIEHKWKPSVRNNTNKYMGGAHYFVLQLDFLLGDKPSRLYLTCTHEIAFDDSFPRDQFLIMGPIQPRNFSIANFSTFMDEFSQNSRTKLKLVDGSLLSWQGADVEKRVPSDHFDPEVVPTTSDWFQSYSPLHILSSIVDSSVEQTSLLICDKSSVKMVYLNGQKVDGFKLDLIEGENRLVILHNHENFTGSGEHAAAFIRLADPKTGERLKTIKYRRPSDSYTSN